MTNSKTAQTAMATTNAASAAPRRNTSGVTTLPVHHSPRPFRSDTLLGPFDDPAHAGCQGYSDVIVTDLDVTRSMWTLFEPVHAVTYFAPEARSAFEEAGLRGFWRGYFAGRAAPLGPVSAAVVGASLFNFSPAMVARAIPAVWELISPAEALRVRQAGAVSALRVLLGGLDSEVTAAADLLGRAAGEADCAGRVLAAANAALPPPEDATGRLWQAATVLREHRGDGHFAAMATADIDGCEVLVLRCGLDMRREDLQPIRGWTDEQWDAAAARLAARGWIGPDGTAHPRGPGHSRHPGNRHRPGRGPALDPPRPGRRGPPGRGPAPGRPGVRPGRALSQPHRRARPRVGSHPGMRGHRTAPV